MELGGELQAVVNFSNCGIQVKVYSKRPVTELQARMFAGAAFRKLSREQRRKGGTVEVMMPDFY